jgi:hypothetical protein
MADGAKSSPGRLRDCARIVDGHAGLARGESVDYPGKRMILAGRMYLGRKRLRRRFFRKTRREEGVD